MNRRNFIKSGSSKAFGSFTANPIYKCEEPDPTAKNKHKDLRPNLEFFFTDQESWYRFNDPCQTKNLFNQVDAKSLKEHLHDRSLPFLEHFNDPFIAGHNILIMLGQDSPFFSHEGTDGVFGGRPIDLIHDYLEKHGRG